MPLCLTPEDGPACDLDECVARIGERGFDPADPGSLHHAAHWLRRLGHNRDFLGDLVLAELSGRYDAAQGGTAYGAQVVMLARPGGDFFLRANIWPSANDYCTRASGEAAFFFDLPHDHNFSFLTLGYYGPGYWSDYYDYVYARVAGHEGEAVDLRFVETSRLEPGKIMLYRAHRDVHVQKPPDSLSVSLNIMHAAAWQGWFDQYRFDVENRRIAGILNQAASDVLLRLAVQLLPGEGMALADHMARHHPSGRVRVAALDALASGGAADIWDRAVDSDCAMVRETARGRLSITG